MRLIDVYGHTSFFRRSLESQTDNVVTAGSRRAVGSALASCGGDTRLALLRGRRSRLASLWMKDVTPAKFRLQPPCTAPPEPLESR